MIKKTFSSYDTIITVISLLSYVLDTISDIFIIVVFYLDGHDIWGSSSLGFISLASVSMLLFSFKWHVTDRTLTWRNFLPHIVFLAPLHRYIEVLRLGYKSRLTQRKEDLDAVLRANVDVSLLRLIQAFTESIPQLVFQLYIILKFTHYNWLIVVSAVFSLTSVAFSLIVYGDALRLAYKDNYSRSWLGILTQTIWKSWMILSRVTAMVVFSLVFHVWIFLAMGVHWIFMTFWITMQNADYGDTACEKRLFNSLSGFIYIFCFLNLKEGHSRSRMAAFYCFILAENSLMMLLWFIYHPENTPTWLEATSLSVVFGGFVLGGILMICYYCCCHPTSRTATDKKDLTAYWFRRANSLPDRERDPIFNVNHSVARVADWLNASVSLSTDMDSGYSIMDSRSLDLSLPDILKNGTYGIPVDSDSSRNLNMSRKSSRRKSKSSLKRKDWNGTMTSTRSSYLSASSSRPLINNSTTSVKYITNSKDTFSFSSEVLLDQHRSMSVNSIASSDRAFALMGQSPRHNLTEDSFYASPEYKATSLSPLDPKKLWEDSENRLNNTASQIIQIVTETNLKRRTSESRITWMKLEKQEHNTVHGEDLKHNYFGLNNNSVGGYSENSLKFPESISTSRQKSLCYKEESPNTSEEDILESSNKENVRPKESAMLSYPQRLSVEYSSCDDSTPGLSNFFGDISSFHVSSPDTGYYYTTPLTAPNVNSVGEETSEYNDSMQSWSKKMLARINRELQEADSTELQTSDKTPSLTSSYIQEENTRSNNTMEYGNSLSSRSSTGRSRSESTSRRQSSSTNIPEMSSSYIRESSGLRSHSRSTTSDIGETSGSLSNGSHQKYRYSSATDKSTDDSGYSVSKSQSVKCLNNEKVQNSLTFVTKLGSDSDFITRLGSDEDFPENFNRTNSQKSLDTVRNNNENNSENVPDIRHAKSLPGLSYLLSESDTTAWMTDESTVDKAAKSYIANTVLNQNDTTLNEDGAVTRDVSKSVRFEDQTPVKNPKVSNLTPVKVGILNQSPFKPGKLIREDLTPVKLEQFVSSPSRPGRYIVKDSSLEVTDFDDSPHRLGRSIDLFDRERYKNSVDELGLDSSMFTEPSNIRVSTLENSPYKFRSRENTCYDDCKENKYNHDMKKDIYRRRSSGIYSKDRTSVENMMPSSSCSDYNLKSSVKNTEQFTNIKPRTVVDDFKRKHVQLPRNTQKKMEPYSNDMSLYQSEAMTNPCYAYSDTESEADLSKGSYIQQDKRPTVRRHSSQFRTPVQETEGKRQVFKRLDNTPGFSPILAPGELEIVRASGPGSNIVKPIVSTPKINQELYKKGLRYINDSPSTIEV